MRAARVMGCSERTVKNALRKSHDISSTFLLRLCAAVLAAGKDPLAVSGVKDMLEARR